ncbi:MAG: EAL domain-containing protein [Parvibaculaceae bacterium]
MGRRAVRQAQGSKLRTRRLRARQRLRASAGFSRSITGEFAKAGLELAEQHADYGAWFWHVPSNTFHMTPNALEMLGLDRSSPTLDEIFAMIHEADQAEVVEKVTTHLENGEPFDMTYRVCRADGSVRHFRGRCHVSRDPGGEPFMFAGSVEDITYQVETLNHLQHSEMRFRSLIESAPFPIVITRPRDRTLQYLNDRARELLDELDVPPGDFMVQDLIKDLETGQKIRDELLAHGRTNNYEISLKRTDGTPLWMAIKGVIIDLDGEPCAYFILYDVTERRLLEDQLRIQATSDVLTGAANRDELMRQLKFEIADANRSQTGFSLLVLDLDNFKMVNDTMGHDLGDKLLVETSKRLHNQLRMTDTVARIGGDEFAVIARHLHDTHGVTVLAQKIIRALSKPFVIDGKVLNVGCCIGISSFPSDKSDPTLLLQHADLALHRAREDGRDQFQLFDEALSHRMHERMELDRDLRAAIRTDQFFVVYQPRFNARTRQPVAAEALARWRHPERGLVSPGAFIPVAEETGLVIDLGRVVLNKVASDLSKWRATGLDVGPVSVNISPIHLAAGTVLEDVLAALEKYELPPACLQVEVTESTMITDEESASSQIKALADAGIEILIDDFGTGYSSLSYLHRFTAHELKIDRSFVSNVMDPTSAILARQIVSIGKSLDLRIVAEGVETESQAEFMTAIGCDELQGFLLARPLEKDVFESLMRERDEGGKSEAASKA